MSRLIFFLCKAVNFKNPSISIFFCKWHTGPKFVATKFYRFAEARMKPSKWLESHDRKHVHGFSVKALVQNLLLCLFVFLSVQLVRCSSIVHLFTFTHAFTWSCRQICVPSVGHFVGHLFTTTPVFHLPSQMMLSHQKYSQKTCLQNTSAPCAC